MSVRSIELVEVCFRLLFSVCSRRELADLNSGNFFRAAAEYSSHIMQGTSSYLGGLLVSHIFADRYAGSGRNKRVGQGRVKKWAPAEGHGQIAEPNKDESVR